MDPISPTYAVPYQDAILNRPDVGRPGEPPPVFPITGQVVSPIGARPRVVNRVPNPVAGGASSAFKPPAVSPFLGEAVARAANAVKFRLLAGGNEVPVVSTEPELPLQQSLPRVQPLAPGSALPVGEILNRFHQIESPGLGSSPSAGLINLAA